VLELLALHLPDESYEQVFDTFIGWARFADLFSYDDQTETVGLQH
jgi:hypothetical protein